MHPDMRFIKELGNGLTKKAFLYEKDGEKITILQAVGGSKERWFRIQARQESYITGMLPPMRCDIRRVRVNYLHGKWEIAAHYVEGQPLTKELLDSLTPEQQTQLADDFAEFLHTLHSLQANKLAERYADETDSHDLHYLLGYIMFRLYCLKKRFLSFKKSGKSPYITSRFAKTKAKIYSRCGFTPAEIALVDQAHQVLNAHPEVFAQVGVCFGDLKPDNILYDTRSSRMSAMDFCGPYRGCIYQEFMYIYAWLGKDFTQQLISKYHTLSSRSAKPMQIDLAMVQHLLAIFLFTQIPKYPLHKATALNLLRELYPDMPSA